MNDRREKGAALLELVASMPLIAALAAAVGTTFIFGVRAYYFLMSDWALQEHVSYAMERIVTDLRYAEDAKNEGGCLKIRCREVGGPVQTVTYERTNETVPRIRRDSQPLTGQSTLGQIAMEDFHVEVGGPSVFLRLAGKNLLTGQTFTLETRVPLMGKAP